MECKNREVKRVQYFVTITRGDLLELIRNKTSLNVPGVAKVSIAVPGGGDWSGRDLVLGEDADDIDVTWITET